jgi:type IV secretory pathway ATPase VirB11/archaellum biosynthesis ATPase
MYFFGHNSAHKMMNTGKTNIVVGTPAALESALSKVRGFAGTELNNSLNFDYAQLKGGFKFSYAVYDEVLNQLSSFRLGLTFISTYLG